MERIISDDIMRPVVERLAVDIHMAFGGDGKVAPRFKRYGLNEDQLYALEDDSCWSDVEPFIEVLEELDK